MVWNVMAILLLLLKIVGILLLILLFLLALILFAPLRYRAYTSFYEQKRFQGRISWLCFVVRAVFFWEEGETRWKLRIFGIPVMSGDGNGSSSSQKNRRKKENKKRKLAKNKQNIVDQEEKTEWSEGRENPEPLEKLEQSGNPRQLERSEKRENPEQTERPGQSGNPVKTEETASKSHADGDGSGSARPSVEKSPAKAGKRRGLIAWLQKLREKIKKFVQTLKKLFRLFREKVCSLRDLADLLREEESRRSICIVKDNMVHLWKQIHPRKIRGDIVFGTGDPCTTGQALGGMSLFYAWIGSGVHIVPDFQEKRLEGKLDVLGRIRIITLIVIIIKLMFHKDVKELWQKLEQWKEDF